ncbi:fatty acid metabolism transcriptional regulator FadR [Motilimonas cestriensis]|uniref:Fatty acid metabolism regulator protein n=1 Tax=Motilimonas cestriensis TaxID=2742685 RepID=A0ABS8W9B3_9GAMM|nr:fatty acid metabolism transcriptional regulator FadR [Motilimonas cestriensis]MCE2594947.1 fatty acid metabolism transcriptional regulator FadR [Motilimonas cestriensis]
MVFRAQSPAGVAEEYLIDSIWNERFPPGSILPAERELSEMIGVTRTTLREVLQRLARDGWLTIRHGKPTQVNDIWQTSGLNILETLARLDGDKFPQLIDQLLSARTNISAIFIRSALKRNPEKVLEIIAQRPSVDANGDQFVDYDYYFYHELALASDNMIYVLVLNGFKNLYKKLGVFYFALPQARHLALEFYLGLEHFVAADKHNSLHQYVREYGKQSAELWSLVKSQLPDSFND